MLRPRVIARKRQFHYRGTATTLRWKGAMLSPQEAKALARASVARQSPRASARGVATGTAQIPKGTKNGACPPTFRRHWPCMILLRTLSKTKETRHPADKRRQTPTLPKSPKTMPRKWAHPAARRQPRAPWAHEPKMLGLQPHGTPRFKADPSKVDDAMRDGERISNSQDNPPTPKTVAFRSDRAGSHTSKTREKSEKLTRP